MNTPQGRVNRVRAYLEFIVAVVYFFMARALARHGAHGLVSEQWTPLVEQAILAFLLLTGYAAMGSWLDREQRPISAQGLPRRQGWQSEAGLGLAFGWSLAVACIIPMTVVGGIAIFLNLQTDAWAWLAAETAFFVLATLVEEIAFRGYGFQRFAEAVGPMGAAVGFAAYYSIVQFQAPGSNHASFAVSIGFSLLLSASYLRTKALWLSWGLNFGWKASRALVFGLAVSGVNSHSPVVQGDPMGPFWLTGGGFGLDGTWVAFVAMLAGLFVIFKLTRELDYKHNTPVIVPAGIPVDLDAAARKQHEAAMGSTEPAPPALVQIFPVAAPPPQPPLD